MPTGKTRSRCVWEAVNAPVIRCLHAMRRGCWNGSPNLVEGETTKKIKSQMPAVEVVHGKAVATYDALVSAIENLVSDARTGLKAAMNAIMLQTYWHTGLQGKTWLPQ